MGKIKSKSIRKASRVLTAEGVKFSGDFEKNKKVLKGLVMSKKLRNQLAGLTAKTRKSEDMKIKVGIINNLEKSNR
jgi:ribosomal protein S17E